VVNGTADGGAYLDGSSATATGKSSAHRQGLMPLVCRYFKSLLQLLPAPAAAPRLWQTLPPTLGQSPNVDLAPATPVAVFVAIWNSTLVLIRAS
jgi:hypothetical protein